MWARSTTFRQSFACRVCFPLLAALLTPSAARAQTAPPPDVWRHGATATVGAGVASASSDVSGQSSASIGWEIASHVTVEGTAFWLERANGGDAYAGTLSLQANLSAPHRGVPFVEAGFGMYHAAFDTTRGELPSFYRDRLPTSTRAAGVRATFNDPATLLGAGVSVFVTPHLALRPEAAVLLVTRNSQSYPVTTVTIRAVYHFEAHPTGSERRGRQR